MKLGDFVDFRETSHESLELEASSQFETRGESRRRPEELRNGGHNGDHGSRKSC